MTITTTETITKQVELELPFCGHYTHYSTHHYLKISEDKTVVKLTVGAYSSITLCQLVSSHEQDATKCDLISQDDFDKVFCDLLQMFRRIQSK